MDRCPEADTLRFQWYGEPVESQFLPFAMLQEHIQTCIVCLRHNRWMTDLAANSVHPGLSAEHIEQWIAAGMPVETEMESA